MPADHTFRCSPVMHWLTVIVALASLVLAVPSTASAVTVSEVAGDAVWILGAQLPDGAIADYVDQQTILPYVASYAAIGLANATRLTGDKRYSDAAWRWLRWYQAHQDQNGFVTDYDVVNGTEVSAGTMDSTDAYAGTFLLAAQATYDVTLDRSQLGNLKAGIAGAVKAIKATQDTDGLTWAKPSWHVKYLMDQAEAWSGLRAAASLALVLNNRTLSNSADGAASRMQTGIQELWEPARNSYDWALHADGAHQTTNWSILYPDAAEQAWPVAFGMVTGTRAAALMSQFEVAQPTWDLPGSLALFDSGTSTVGYWPMAVWSFAAVGQLSTAATALSLIRNAALAIGRAWPFTTADAGELLAIASTSAAAVSWPYATATPF